MLPSFSTFQRNPTDRQKQKNAIPDQPGHTWLHVYILGYNSKRIHTDTRQLSVLNLLQIFPTLGRILGVVRTTNCNLMTFPPFAFFFSVQANRLQRLAAVGTRRPTHVTAKDFGIPEAGSFHLFRDRVQTSGLQVGSALCGEFSHALRIANLFAASIHQIRLQSKARELHCVIHKRREPVCEWRVFPGHFEIRRRSRADH